MVKPLARLRGKTVERRVSYLLGPPRQVFQTYRTLLKFGISDIKLLDIVPRGVQTSL